MYSGGAHNDANWDAHGDLVFNHTKHAGATDQPIAGQSSYNVTPFEAGSFFTKIDCFCFTEQILQPGERVEMPVTFYVDPEMVDDRDAKLVHTITLSYTFYEIDMPEDHAALDRTGETEIKQN